MKIVQPDRPIFIYLLRQPSDNAIRYVGQSVYPDKRLWAHIAEARSGARSHRSNWIRKLLAAGEQPILEIIEEATVETWIEREQFWIAFYRAAGCRLVNATDGGEGTLGHKLSDEARAKMSAVRKGRKRDPDAVRRGAEKNRGRKMPIEVVEQRYEQYRMLSPSGEEIEIHGLAPFCRRHGLDPFSFANVLNGRSRHHRGWQIRQGDDGRAFFPIKALKGLPSIVTDPEGERHLVLNLSRFCEERGVKRGALEWSEKRRASMGGWQMCRAVWVEGGWQIPEDWERWPEFVPDYEAIAAALAKGRAAVIAKGGSFLGRTHSEETKARVRAAKLGMPSPKKGKPAPEGAIYYRKTYIVTSPEGQVFTVFRLSTFCEEHGLQRSVMVSVASGKWTHHKGWRCRRLEDLPVQLPLPFKETE